MIRVSTFPCDLGVVSVVPRTGIYNLARSFINDSLTREKLSSYMTWICQIIETGLLEKMSASLYTYTTTVKVEGFNAFVKTLFLLAKSLNPATLEKLASFSICQANAIYKLFKFYIMVTANVNVPEADTYIKIFQVCAHVLCE